MALTITARRRLYCLAVGFIGGFIGGAIGALLIIL